ncbi:hypothetical protein LEP1GSC072_0575 [Leptospira noguchii str. Bonito]|nr:hypothetical protein LEP1GSC072_0575 [Leptospira noguchii str. Bonito]
MAHDRAFRSNSFGISATIAFAFVMPNSRYFNMNLGPGLENGGLTRRRGSGSLRLQRGEGFPLQKTELKYDRVVEKLTLLLFYGNVKID